MSGTVTSSTSSPGAPGQATSTAMRLSRPVAFVVASWSLVLVFAAAGAPIPLFNLYRAEDAITNGDLGWVSVGYFVAAAVSLLLLGRLSNHLGRRVVAIAALVSAALSCLVLMSLRGVEPLFFARVLQGLACGVASSGLAAYVVDTAPARPRWLAALITGSAPMVGIPLGAIASGALAQFGPAPRSLVFEIAASLLAICAVLVSLSPETMPRRAGAIGSLRPRMEIPDGSHCLVLAAGAAFVGTWALGGFYQAFGPSVVAQYLGTPSPLLAAAVFSSFMVLFPVGGSVAGRVSSIAGLRIGMVLFVIALAGIVGFMNAGSVVPFMAATLLAGIANGVASTGAIRALLARSTPDRRAGLLSTLYLISYGGAVVPGIVAGRLAATWSLFHIALGYAALGLASAVVALLASRQAERRSS